MKHIGIYQDNYSTSKNIYRVPLLQRDKQGEVKNIKTLAQMPIQYPHSEK